jgi:hypothetical protein
MHELTRQLDWRGWLQPAAVGLDCAARACYNRIDSSEGREFRRIGFRGQRREGVLNEESA